MHDFDVYEASTKIVKMHGPWVNMALGLKYIFFVPCINIYLFSDPSSPSNVENETLRKYKKYLNLKIKI